MTSSVTLRKETAGRRSEEGREPVVGTGTAGTVVVSSQIDKEPKTAGGKPERNKPNHHVPASIENLCYSH